MNQLPDDLLDIDFESALFIVVLLTWSWVVAFSVIRVWRFVVCRPPTEWAFSIRQLFFALTIIAVVMGLSAAIIRW